MKNKKGFTLIELLVTVSIIGILAAMAYSSFRTYKFRTYVAVVIDENRNFFTAATDYISNTESATSNSATVVLCTGLTACKAFFPNIKFRDRIGDITLLGMQCFNHPVNGVYTLMNYFRSDTLDYIGCERLEKPTLSSGYTQNCTMLYQGTVQQFRN